MKPTTILLAAILTLHTGFLFAGNELFASSAPAASSALNISSLVPSTPSEATFEDFIIFTADNASLAPSLPAEADFSDVAPEMNANVSDLSPVTPAEADFSDSPEIMINVSELAPATPSVADFE